MSTPSEIVMLDGIALAGAIRSRRTSCVDVMTAYLDHIDQYNRSELGCLARAAPAGFSENGLPIGIQIIGPNRSELGCLQIAYAYELATDWTHTRLPPLLK